MILFVALFFPPLTTADSPTPVRLGSVAMDTPAIMHKRLLPLTQYLSEFLQRPVVLKLSPDMPAAINEVASGNVDVAYLTPVAYIRANAQGNSQLVAKTVTKQKSAFQLMIVVREDSAIKTVQDLEGKKFAFGDQAALLQRAAVVGAGVPLDKLGAYEFLGHYDNIVRSVLHGDFDAGILKDTMAFKWEGKGIRILYRTPDLPPYNIAASGKIDQQLLNQLRQAFLNLDANNPQHHNIIKALDKKYDGFAPTSDAEYDVVRQLIKPFK
ncbi:MAG: phosphonate ABC transporter substrate-binding protein [Gammaproteobacteria bacterium SG8_11]|nr:MAG: phosphonate ABC transporter substrate-binding protein [Gammaproteobacteria bacterium SG8_11]